MPDALLFETFQSAPGLYGGRIPELKEGSYSILFDYDHYDGIISGFLKYSGNPFIFLTITPLENPKRPRMYAVCETSETEIKEYQDKIKEIQQLLNDHPLSVVSKEGLPPFWEAYYTHERSDRSFPEIDLTGREVVYRFTL